MGTVAGLAAVVCARMEPDQAPISKRRLLPRDCCIGFGIPTEAARFWRDYKSPTSDFARSFTSWTRYEHEVVQHVRRVVPLFGELGVHVIHDLSMSSLRSCFSRAPFSVMILFSHWRGDRVELFDGLTHAADVVACVPEDFAGIVDLCVCHPATLVRALQTRRSKCLVRFGEDRATPAFWLFFYLVLFKCLASGGETYLSAFERVVREFLR